MQFSDQMALAANIIAAVGGLAGLVALGIAIRAERRASAAEKAGDRAKQRELWSELIFSVQAILGASTAHEKFHPLLVRIRSAMTELIDGYPDAQGDALGRWLSAEHQVLNILLERAMLNLGAVPNTVEAIEEAHRPSNTWTTGLLQNLRVARKRELDADFEKEVLQLAEHAEHNLEALWPGGERPGQATPDKRA